MPPCFYLSRHGTECLSVRQGQPGAISPKYARRHKNGQGVSAVIGKAKTSIGLVGSAAA